jgi:ATP-dependent Lon protease
MQHVKEQILLFVSSKIQNPHMKRCSLGLIGAPGTGKTAISRLLAKVLDFPFEQISLGGISNPDYLKGHEYTYVGAQPGEISKCLKRMKFKNGILFLDEFDKISDNNDMCSALLHITDPIQNSEFRDKFLSEITIDLSYLWFIYSMNELPRDSALSDRIYTIQVPGYQLQDKVCIITHYLVPKALRNINISENSIKISPKIAEYLIKEKTDWENSVGVRAIEKVVNNIVSKIDFLVKHQDKKGKLKGFDVSFNTGKVVKYPVTITREIIQILCK